MRELCGKSMAALLFGALLFLGAKSGAPPTAHGFEWVPSPEEIQKYRRTWNPLSNGPMFISGVDIHPKGQLTAHPFVFSQISEKRFGNQLTVDRTTTSTHVYQIAPLVTMAYGITDHLELNAGLGMSAFWAKDTTQFNQERGGRGPRTRGWWTPRSISNTGRS